MQRLQHVFICAETDQENAKRMGARVISETLGGRTTLWVSSHRKAEPTYKGFCNSLCGARVESKLHDCLEHYPGSPDVIAETLGLLRSISTPVLIVSIQKAATGQLAQQYNQYLFKQECTLDAVGPGKCWHLRPGRDPEQIAA